MVQALDTCHGTATTTVVELTDASAPGTWGWWQSIHGGLPTRRGGVVATHPPRRPGAVRPTPAAMNIYDSHTSLEPPTRHHTASTTPRSVAPTGAFSRRGSIEARRVSSIVRDEIARSGRTHEQVCHFNDAAVRQLQTMLEHPSSMVSLYFVDLILAELDASHRCCEYGLPNDAGGD